MEGVVSFITPSPVRFTIHIFEMPRIDEDHGEAASQYVEHRLPIYARTLHGDMRTLAAVSQSAKYSNSSVMGENVRISFFPWLIRHATTV